MDKAAMRQKVEGACLDICLQCGDTEANHLDLDTDERRKKLVRLAIKSLQGLLSGGDAAMSLETPLPGNLDRACDALTHYCGVYVPPERRR